MLTKQTLTHAMRLTAFAGLLGGLLIFLTGLGNIVDTPGWSPVSGTIAIDQNRSNAQISLLWDKIPDFTALDKGELTWTRALEIELILPGATRAFPLDPKNNLKFAKVIGFSDDCQHRDIYVQDTCEQWSLQLLTKTGCLPDYLQKKKTVTIALQSKSALPQEIKSGQLQISRIGLNYKTAGTKLGAVACSGLCAMCNNFTIPILDPVRALECKASTAALNLSGLSQEGLRDICHDCPGALAGDPGWNYFTLGWRTCAESVCVPGATKFGECKFQDKGCDEKFDQNLVDTMCNSKVSCAPGLSRCESGVLRTCNSMGSGYTTTICSSGVCADDKNCKNSLTCSSGDKRCSGTSLQTCASDGSGWSAQNCSCGCVASACVALSCSPGVKRCNGSTLEECTAGGCGWSRLEDCRYGCSVNTCMSAPPPTELCNGLDDDGNGIVDDPLSCWKKIYRFENSTTKSRCYGTSTSPPVKCSGYFLERTSPVFIVSAYSVPNTREYRQCSNSTDHVLSIAGSPEQTSLQSSGWDCSLSLGYFYDLGKAPPTGKTPFAGTCPLYRFRYNFGSGQSHLFTLGSDILSGMICEPPARADVLSEAMACFSGTPSGC